ncbi:MAG: MATE family efflux transporter, partial [Selenomonadaceae bacterium]|nr:MATE family efflux transporter [Selenomonadaceae bacterium]
MLRGSLWDKIIIFALPLALTGVMQQLLNAADVITLGKFVGKHAMAAVGNNISLVGLIVSLLMGLSLGANVVIAQNIGAKRIDRAESAVSTSFILAGVAGIFFCV